MLVYFGVETLTENNGVYGLPSRRSLSRFSSVEPELHAIKEVNPTPVEDGAGGSLAISAEEDARRKDALETLDDAAVVKTVLGQLNKIEYLSGGTKMNLAALLPDSQRSSPKWDQPILTKGQTKGRMSNDFQEKLPVLPAMKQLAGRWTTQRNATEHERAGVIRHILLPILPLLANHLDGLELPNGLLGNANPWED